MRLRSLDAALGLPRQEKAARGLAMVEQNGLEQRRNHSAWFEAGDAFLSDSHLEVPAPRASR
jgi:hypothetical protein